MSEQPHPSSIFSPVPQSLLPSFCLFFDFLHLFSLLSYMNTSVFKYSTSLGVQTLSPGEHPPKQTKRQLSGVAVQGKNGWQSSTGSLVNPVNNKSSVMSIITVGVVLMGPQTGFSLLLMLWIFCTSCQVVHVVKSVILRSWWFPSITVHDY